MQFEVDILIGTSKKLISSVVVSAKDDVEAESKAAKLITLKTKAYKAKKKIIKKKK